jgi:endonuclease/exonuclease/phosphatase family metal-dependent hydrolase
MYKGLVVANTHCLPLVIFGRDYRKGEAKLLGDEIEALLIKQLQEPVILCGDFGMSEGQSKVLARLIEKLQLKNALPAEPTYHAPAAYETDLPNAPDCIYFSQTGLLCLQSAIVRTQTDHYLGWAEFALIAN